ncbi:hypothetical protein B0H12DRAFT_1239926 [Mycena haematopus]|nr:hypothetical protein B0H12DRAFT_1239926 [Mycena haematopus]
MTKSRHDHGSRFCQAQAVLRSLVIHSKLDIGLGVPPKVLPFLQTYPANIQFRDLRVTTRGVTSQCRPLSLTSRPFEIHRAMSEWKPQVVEAFQTLNLDIDVATLEHAAKAYKTQAIRHHPDKNPGDPAATQRFQKLGAAWDTCQRHFEDPESYVTSASNGPEIDPEDLAYFIVKGSCLRKQFGNAISAVATIDVPAVKALESFSRLSAYLAPLLRVGPIILVLPPIRAAARDKAEYEDRLREFEKQIEKEKRELHRQAMEKSKDEDKRAAAYQQAFHAARAGKAALVMSLVQEYDLDVNGPEKMSKVTSKKADKPTTFQTLLHAACRVCDEGLIIFLLDRGAIPDALNDAKLTPFHVAISCGNVAAVKFFLLRRVHGKQTPGCHPSKVAADGRTPLQLAIASENAEMVTIMTQQATVHDVERCWLQSEATPFRNILLEKKGFVDPETRELRRQQEERKAAEERAREEQRVADEKERLAEKARLKEERQKRVAEQKAREEVKKREEAALARQKQEAEDRKAELERIAAEARRREEQEVAEAQRRSELQEAEARRKVEAAARRKAQQEVEARRKADAKREAEARSRAEQEAAETRRRAAEVEAERLKAEVQARQLAEEQERARRQAEENTRLQQVAAQEAERQSQAALEQQRVERKRAQTLRRLQAQAEEHRRLAEIKVHAAEPKPVASQRPSVLETQNGRKLPKKFQNRDLSQLSPDELQKRAAQSARDKARIAEQKRLKMLEANAQTRPDTPESLHRGRQTEDYIPPTPVSMPSPTQRRLSPPLVPHHTRPNVPARKMDPLGILLLGPEDIQTGAIPDDLFAIERPQVAPVPETRESEAPPAFRGRGRGGYRARGRGRGRGDFLRNKESNWE